MTQLTYAALDPLFEFKGGTPAHLAIGVRVGGVDIANRYMDIAQGGSASAPITNIRSGGNDIRTFFVAKGTLGGPFTAEVFGPFNTFLETLQLLGADYEVITDGGTAPFLYNWQYVSGSTAVTVDNSANKFPTFTTSVTTGLVTTTWKLEVTDLNGLGTTITSNDFTMIFNFL